MQLILPDHIYSLNPLPVPSLILPLPFQVSDLFGPKISAATHGVMIAVWSAAGIIGIPVFGSFTGRYWHYVKGVKTPEPVAYIYNTWWLCGLPALSFVALLFMNVRVRDRRLRQVSGGRGGRGLG